MATESRNVVLLNTQFLKKKIVYFKLKVVCANFAHTLNNTDITHALVTIQLTKDFLEADIFDNAAFAYSSAIFCEIPAVVVNLISTHDVLGRLWALATAMYYKQQTDLISQLYTYIKLAMAVIIFATALTAPTAAAYISYTTLGADGMDPVVQWMAVVAITIVRITFSNFTLNEITNSVLGYHHQETHPKEDAASQTLRLMKFQKTVDDTKVAFFRQRSSSLNGEEVGNENTPLLDQADTARAKLCTIL